VPDIYVKGHFFGGYSPETHRLGDRFLNSTTEVVVWSVTRDDDNDDGWRQSAGRAAVCDVVVYDVAGRSDGASQRQSASQLSLPRSSRPGLSTELQRVDRYRRPLPRALAGRLYLQKHTLL